MSEQAGPYVTEAPQRRLSANPVDAPPQAQELSGVSLLRVGENADEASEVNTHRAPRPVSGGRPPRPPPAPSPAYTTAADHDLWTSANPRLPDWQPSSVASARTPEASRGVHGFPQGDSTAVDKKTESPHAHERAAATAAAEVPVDGPTATALDGKAAAPGSTPLSIHTSPSMPASKLPSRRASFAGQPATFFVPVPEGLGQSTAADRSAALTQQERDPLNEALEPSLHARSSVSSLADTTTRAPIDNKLRFRYLFVGLLVMLMSSIVGTFAIFGFYVQKAYAYTPEDMINLFVVGTSCGLAATFFSGVLYDLYAQRFMVVITGILMMLPACLLLGLAFHGELRGTKAQFMGFFFLLNVGAYGLDLTAMITTVTHFPRNRGMVCGLLKTFSGLGASFYSCLYRGYLYNKKPANNFANLFFFLTALLFVLGVVCTIFFKPAKWADTRFYRYARRRRAEQRMPCLRRLFGCTSDAETHIDEDAGFMTQENVEAHLLRYFLAKVPYLKYRPPQRRIRIAFLILLAINVYMTLQLILVAYLEVTDRGALNGIATGALILVLLTSVLAWPFDFLDEEVNYARSEVDINEDGLPIGKAGTDALEDETSSAPETDAQAPLVLKPATMTMTNPLAFALTDKEGELGGGDTAQGVGDSSRVFDTDEREAAQGQPEAAHPITWSAPLPQSHRASGNPSFSSPPASRLNRLSASLRGGGGGANSSRPNSAAERQTDSRRHSAMRNRGAAAPSRANETPLNSRTRADRQRYPEYEAQTTLSQLLFAREVTEAVSMLDQSVTLRSPPVERATVPLSATRRTSTSLQSPPNAPVPNGSLVLPPPACLGEAMQPVPSAAPSPTTHAPAPSASHLAGNDSFGARGHLSASATFVSRASHEEGDEVAELRQTQREVLDDLMKTVLVQPVVNRRIPVNGDTVTELIKYRDGFWRALLTPELWVLLWLSFTVWATGLTATSNLFIQLFYAAEDKAAMSNKLYYLFAALSGIAIGGGRVAIGTIADDLLPAFRRKYKRPFGLNFTLLLVFPPWATVVGIIFFMAIPGATLQIIGQLFVAFSYGLTTSAVPYAITVFFSFEYVGLGKMYGLCLLAVGAGVAVLYRAAFAETYKKEAFPAGNPAIPPAAWGMCLKGKKPCTLDFFIVCLVLNVVAGAAAVYLHLRFQSRLNKAAREQIEIVEARTVDPDVDVAYLHEWAQQ